MTGRAKSKEVACNGSPPHPPPPGKKSRRTTSFSYTRIAASRAMRDLFPVLGERPHAFQSGLGEQLQGSRSSVQETKGQNAKPPRFLQGFLLLGGFLALDGLTSTFQEKLFKARRAANEKGLLR